MATETTTSTATPTTVPPQADLMGTILPFLVIFVVFYFLILRPQQRKYKTHQAMVSAVQRGDKIITSGGILGKVTQVDDKDGILQVEIADGVKIKVVASTITTVVADKPVNDNVVAKKAKAK